MANYAVMNGNLITNVIVAESLEDAEQLTGAKCIELSTEPGSPGPGWTLQDDNTWLNPLDVQPTPVTE